MHIIKKQVPNAHEIISQRSTNHNPAILDQSEKIYLWYFMESVIGTIVEGRNLELVSKELNHLAAILHVYAGGLIFMK